MRKRKMRVKNQENVIICNDCGSVLKMKIHEGVIDHDADGKEIREQYLRCSRCKRRFTVIILDEYMKANISEMRVTTDYMKKQNLKKEMKEHLEELKQRYGRT